jgi:hypothetical protein
LGVGITADAFAGLEISYNRRIMLSGKASRIGLALKTPALSDVLGGTLNAAESEISLESRIISSENFLLLCETRAGIGFHNQILGVFYPANISFRITPALKTSTGYWGLTAGFRQTVANYIVFSDYTKERFNDIYDSTGKPIDQQPQNGFYPCTGQRIDIGITGRLSIMKKDYLYIEAGYSDFLSAYTGAFNAMMYGQLPFFMKLKYEITLR